MRSDRHRELLDNWGLLQGASSGSGFAGSGMSVVMMNAIVALRHKLKVEAGINSDHLGINLQLLRLV
jgi:hypothetical protein